MAAIACHVRQSKTPPANTCNVQRLSPCSVCTMAAWLDISLRWKSQLERPSKRYGRQGTHLVNSAPRSQTFTYFELTRGAVRL